ncbi:hypothetical protein C1893_16385 [Pseudomonas sp. MPR-ANC1]|nr:hypothetical protein C1893_16385 [Pseudomonas sp. MPR-ANC1]
MTRPQDLCDPEAAFASRLAPTFNRVLSGEMQSYVGASLLANEGARTSLINDDPPPLHPDDCPTPCGSAPVHRES